MTGPSQVTQRPSMRVTSYNVLANSYATKRLYPTVPPETLDWTRRGPMVASRIEELHCDVACLQEVEAAHWPDLRALLVPRGWSGIFAQKGRSRVDGCALLYRTDAASLSHSEAIHFSDGDEPSGHLALIGVFSTAIGPLRIVSTHLRWQADTIEPIAHIGYRQAAQLLKRCSTAGDPEATVICGDFNVRPEHPLIQLFRDHDFQDAYSASPQSSCAPNGRASRLDYIFVSRHLRAVGQPLPTLENGEVLPDVDQPSDHLPITASIETAVRHTESDRS